MQQLGTHLKPYLRWLIFGGVLFFLGKAFKAHAAEVTAVRIHGGGWMYLAIALIVTLLAHALAGWVWSWVLQGFKYPVSSPWAIQVYLKSNLAKYLPGSVWHYYGRISKVTEAGVPTAKDNVSVLIEPPLMSAAALLLVLVGSQLNQGLSQNFNLWNWQILGLVGVLLLLHPWCLNPILQLMGKFKGKSKNSAETDVADCKLEAYPFLPLLGAIGFLILRSLGFLLMFLALTPVAFHQIPMLLSAFNLAWLSPIILPAAPGGIGVFEETAIALLNQPFSTGVVLSVVALYRLISIVAEATGAGLASLNERRIESQKV
ncbi:MAG TPA: UPF0104 family protein [Allocoleopsis sp.]